MITTRLAPILATAAAAVVPVGISTAAPIAAPPVPPGYQWVEDETGTIGVAIPVDWTVGNPMELVATKVATSSIDASAPGDASLAFWAEASTGEPQPWDPATCDPMERECSALLSTTDYDDGSFAGYRQTIEECCAGGPFDVVVAAARDGSLTVHLVFDFGETRDPAEVSIFDTMLSTVARVGAPLPQVPPLSEPVFPFGDFHRVPQLGSEPVRGSGCGTSGQIGDVIPDGVWAGFASVDDATVIIDLVCVFTPEAAQGVINDGSANIIHDDPSYLVVNNNERERTVPAAATLELRDASWNDRLECVEGSYIADIDHDDYQAWVTIEDGMATSIVWGCERIV